ncbi:hypothetical protein WOSG25_420010, partial [Weissella oryzae SG25]
MMTVAEKLLKVQTELKAPKGQFNSFGKYKYRSAEDILEAVKPLLQSNQLSITLSDEPILVGNRIYIKATATAGMGEDDAISVSGFAREPDSKKGMDESQITGTASSYARKYALNGLLLIDDNKDADTDEYANQTKRSTNQSNRNAKQFAQQNVGQQRQQQQKAGVEHQRAIVEATIVKAQQQYSATNEQAAKWRQM